MISNSINFGFCPAQLRLDYYTNTEIAIPLVLTSIMLILPVCDIKSINDEIITYAIQYNFFNNN